MGSAMSKWTWQKAEATFDEVKPVDMEVVKERIRKAGYDIA